MSIEDYDRLFAEILERLDANQVGPRPERFDPAVLGEPETVRCHRRFVAEWIESETGIFIPEMDVEEVMDYQDMPLKGQEAEEEVRSTAEQSLHLALCFKDRSRLQRNH